MMEFDSVTDSFIAASRSGKPLHTRSAVRDRLGSRDIILISRTLKASLQTSPFSPWQSRNIGTALLADRRVVRPHRRTGANCWLSLDGSTIFVSWQTGNSRLRAVSGRNQDIMGALVNAIAGGPSWLAQT